MRRMQRAVYRYWRSFSIGFIFAFVAYLFIRWDPEKVFTGVGVAAAVGVALVLLVEIVIRPRWRAEDESAAER